MKRFLSLVLILLSFVPACSSRQARDAATNSSSQKSGPVQLTLWHAYGGVLGEQFQALVEEFNQTHPDILVEPSYGGTLWTMRDKLFTAVSGDAAPDVAQIDQFWSSELADAGAIERVGGWLSADDRQDIWPLAWDTAVYNGEIWSMPFSLSNITLYYNRALFQAAGLDPDAPPSTWPELETAAAALTSDTDQDGQIDRWGLSFPLTADEGVVYYWFAMLWQAGGDIFSQDLSASRFQETPGVTALAFLQRLVQAGSMPLAPPEQGFETGQIGMTLASTARLNRYTEALGEDLGIAPLPQGPAGKATGVGGANLAVMASCKDKEAAWTFISWMTSVEINLRWSMDTGYLPLRQSVVASEAYQAYLDHEPRARVILDQMDVSRVRPNIPEYAAASREIGLAIEEALFTNADPAASLGAAAEKVDKALAASRSR